MRYVAMAGGCRRYNYPANQALAGGVVEWLIVRNFLFSSGEAALYKIVERFYNLKGKLGRSEDLWNA